MAKYDGSKISVVNWNIYNPRSDSKKPSWFRLENDIATGPSFYGLDCEQKWLWIVILSLVSQKNGEEITWNASYVHSLTGISQDKQDATLEIFEKFVRLRVSRNVTSRRRKVTSEPSPATNERTNETNETNERDTATSIVPIVIAGVTDPIAIEFLTSVKTDLQKSWVSTYATEWVSEELQKVANWVRANPTKRPKSNYARFLNSWFERGWERHRKNIPSNQSGATHIDWNKIGGQNAIT